MFDLVASVINLVLVLVLCGIGRPVSPALALIPSLFCALHYAELNWFIYHEGSGKNDQNRSIL